MLGIDENLFRNNRHNILVSHRVTQPDPLWYMSCACSPYHCVLEVVLERPMNLITDVLDGRVIPDDQCFAEVGFFPLAARMSAAHHSPSLVDCTHRLVYILSSCSSYQHRSTTSWMPRSSSQLITTVSGSRASLSRKSRDTESILL